MKAPVTTHAVRYPVLDGVRGLAIAFVVLSHICDRMGGPFEGLGQFGVWLFFALSAFLLSLYFFERPERMWSPLEWTNYFFRRTMRIYPIFIIALCVGAVLGIWGWKYIMPALVLHDPVYWAIFVEFRAYFFLPFIIVGFQVAARLHRVLPVALLGLALAVHFYIFTPVTTVAGYDAWDHPGSVAYEYLICFVIGSFTAWLYVNSRDALARWKHSRLADAVLLLAFIAPWLLGSQVLNSAFGLSLMPAYYHMQWVGWSAYFALLIFGVMCIDGCTRAALSTPLARSLGYASYSLYMFMDFIIGPIAHSADRSWFLLVVFAAVPLAAMSTAVFVLIERPLSRLSLLKIIGRRSAPKAAPMTIPAE